MNATLYFLGEDVLYCFTEHARERWVERIGGELPSSLEIEGIIEESILLQRFRRAYTPRGMPLVFLAMYWNVGRGIVMKVDEKCGKVVTIIGTEIGCQMSEVRERRSEL